MKEVTLFEQLVLWLLRNSSTFTITTGLMYGHKMCKLGNYTFIELGNNTVSVSSDNFNYSVTTTEELLKFARAVM